jgi:hypothetical protein
VLFLEGASLQALPIECGAGAPAFAGFIPAGQYRMRAFMIGPGQSQEIHEVVIAFITDAAVVTAILAHLGLPTQAPPLTPARAPPNAHFPFDGRSDAEVVDPPPTNLPDPRFTPMLVWAPRAASTLRRYKLERAVFPRCRIRCTDPVFSGVIAAGHDARHGH